MSVERFIPQNPMKGNLNSLESNLQRTKGYLEEMENEIRREFSAGVDERGDPGRTPLQPLAQLELLNNESYVVAGAAENLTKLVAGYVGEVESRDSINKDLAQKLLNQVYTMQQFVSNLGIEAGAEELSAVKPQSITSILDAALALNTKLLTVLSANIYGEEQEV